MLTLVSIVIFVYIESYTIKYKSKAMKIKILSFFLLSFWFIQSQAHGPSQTEESLEEQFWESIQNEQAGLDS